MARAAFAEGKAVICEKPLARTHDDALALAGAARAAGAPLYVAHVVRYFPAYAELRRAVESGRLGELAVLRFSRSSAYPAGAEWYGAEELSGGIILDQMIHDLDQARWLAGEVESVFAQATRRSQGDPVHAAHVLLRHASGAISSCAGVWGPHHLEFTTGFSVAGSRGRLEYARDPPGRPVQPHDGSADLVAQVRRHRQLRDGGVEQGREHAYGHRRRHRPPSRIRSCAAVATASM